MAGGRECVLLLRRNIQKQPFVITRGRTGPSAPTPLIYSSVILSKRRPQFSGRAILRGKPLEESWREFVVKILRTLVPSE